jgi:hypothetical protein
MAPGLPGPPLAIAPPDPPPGGVAPPSCPLLHPAARTSASVSAATTPLTAHDPPFAIIRIPPNIGNDSFRRSLGRSASQREFFMLRSVSFPLRIPAAERGLENNSAPRYSGPEHRLVVVRLSVECCDLACENAEPMSALNAL